LYTFAEAVTKTCVIYLGLNQNRCAWCAGADQELCKRVKQEILDSGNFGRKSGSVHATSGFLASGIFNNLNRLTKKRYPICDKYPLLTPFLWATIPIRYFLRMLQGKRPKESVTKVANLARERKKLFQDLGLRQ